MDISKIGQVLCDTTAKMSSRFRALFMLRGIANKAAVEEISKCFVDDSDLLNHELAYCLGQMQNEAANPILSNLLQNENLAPILRHEAAEALGAIGSLSSLPVVEKYCSDNVQAVAETCELAKDRIKWVHKLDMTELDDNEMPSPFSSVDPTPAGLNSKNDITALKNVLTDNSKPLFERYQAMFSLRNINNSEAAVALAEGLFCAHSALFRHEVAYVLGQMQNPAVVQQLHQSLSNLKEDSMVRHESAEALGSIATKECFDILKEYLHDRDDIVKESCEVALDMLEFENSTELNYSLKIESS